MSARTALIPPPGQDDQMNCLIILVKQRRRGDLVRIVRFVRTFLRKNKQSAGDAKKEKAHS
jgi:hypothetical protein